MNTFTRAPEFTNDVIMMFRSSRRLKRRSPIMERALKAHTDRDYLVSVPLMMIQLEGCMNDLMTVQGLVRRLKGKFFKRDRGEDIDLSPNHKKFEMKGLHDKAKLAFPDEALHMFRDMITNYFAPMRNSILHGNLTRYGKSKTSTQLAFFLMIVSDMIIQIEESRVEQTDI